jgi:hypothetical protein
MTRTYSTTDIIIDTRRKLPSPTIFAQDLSIETSETLHLTPYELQRINFAGIDPQHLRYFGSMRDLTMWLHEVGAIVNRCVVLVNE